MNAPTDRPLRVALTVLGCKVNFAEMADLAGTLAAAGCDVVPESEPADVRVLNSCTVTTQADATTRQRIRRLRRLDPGAHLVLTGCSVDTNPDAYTSVELDIRESRQGPHRRAHPRHDGATHRNAGERTVVASRARLHQGPGRLRPLHVLHRLASARPVFQRPHRAHRFRGFILRSRLAAKSSGGDVAGAGGRSCYGVG